MNVSSEFANCHVHGWQVKLELLTSVMKMFFKRPPESIKMLGAALTAGLADVHQVSYSVFSTSYFNCVHVDG